VGSTVNLRGKTALYPAVGLVFAKRPILVASNFCYQAFTRKTPVPKFACHCHVFTDERTIDE